jgi:RPA family protein
MNLESAYFVVQILVGIAVVASLLYVGLQVRENTRATRMAAVQDLQALVGKVEELVIADGGLAEGRRSERVS